MKSISISVVLLTGLVILAILSGCNGASQNDGSASVIETYFQALVGRDFNKMVNVSCNEWETNAKVEFDSFAAVRLELKDLACQEVEQKNDHSVVSCRGLIIANYGAEDLEINIADRTYKVVKEDGEWRMCGYQ